MSAVTLAHRVDGPDDAPALVLSSSLGCTRAAWAPQLPALTGSFRVVSYDHRGHGQSPVPAGPYTLDDMGEDVIALLDRLEIERAHLCGLSLGGMVGMWLAVHHPARVDRLVLCCTFARNAPDAPWDDRIEAVRAGGPGAVADGVVARWLTPQFAEREPETRAWLRAMIAGQPTEGYAAACAAVRDMDLLGSLSGVRAPALVIAGAQDEAAPPPNVELVAQEIRGARFEVLSPAAHLANVERPEAFTELVLAHLGD